MDGLLVISDLDNAPYKEVIQEATARGAHCEFKACNVQDEQQVQDLGQFALDSFGGLDVMVANAAIRSLNLVTQTSHEQLQEMIDTNIHGTLHCIKHAGRALVTSGLVTSGQVKGSSLRIIVAGSVTGKKGASCFSVSISLILNSIVGVSVHAGYVSTKFAIRGIVQTAALEFGSYGITVNSYAPGLIKTDMSDGAAKEFSKIAEGIPRFKAQANPEVYAKLQLEQSALKRSGEPHEVASLVSYLASEGSSFLTGQSISIDGRINFD
ncbi:hypothetical protein C8J56DRAFT_186991 [Mycena floridula]|nr:hypothetical protein C8J56DRAFT_186991 [Mycena floridula]